MRVELGMKEGVKKASEYAQKMHTVTDQFMALRGRDTERYQSHDSKIS